jgi:hypothetical protein
MGLTSHCETMIGETTDVGRAKRTVDAGAKARRRYQLRWAPLAGSVCHVWA